MIQALFRLSKPFKQRVINAAAEKLNREPLFMKEIPPSPGSFSSASAGTTSNNDSKARHSCRNGHYKKDPRNHKRSVESCDKCKKQWRSSSLWSQADVSLKISVSDSSSSISRSIPRNSDWNRRKYSACSDKKNLKVILFVNHRFK